MNRRHFLLSLPALLALPRQALGFGDYDKLEIGQVLYAGGNPLPRPHALRRLMWELDKRTSIEVRTDGVPVRLSDMAELSRHPLLYLSGDRPFPLPGDDDIARLRRHLTAGGMLIIDSAEGRAGGGFDQSVRALCARLFPRVPLSRLAEDHVLFRSFYLLRVPVGRVLALTYLDAVQIDGRAAIVYSQNDMGGAWARDPFGQWEHDVVPGGEVQREQAFRLGVNLAMYALCLDYKTDQVHVPFIMRRRAWQVPPPEVREALPPARSDRPDRGGP